MSTARVASGTKGPLVVALEPIETLEREWDDLFARARTQNVFVSYTFLRTWWDHFARERDARLYVVREPDGRLVAIVPLCVEARETRLGSVVALRNLGYGDVVNPDFLDALVETGRETDVARALQAVLVGDASWHYAEFSELEPEGSLTRMAEHWHEHSRGELRARQEPRSTCPFIKLPASFDDYLASCNPHFRQQLRRYRRKIEKDLRIEWKRVGEDVDVATGVEQLARLHQERMEATERGGNFRKDDYLAFHRDLAERMARKGGLFFWLIYVDGAPAATHYGFLDERSYYGYQMGFAPRYHKYSPGHYMTGRVMEMLIERGVGEMNLLRGTDEWKFRWTETTRKTATVRLWRRGFSSDWAYWREQLSQPPALVCRFLLGRDAFDEVRAAWKNLAAATEPFLARQSS